MKRKADEYIKFTLVLLVIILAALLVAFIKEYSDLRKAEVLGPREAFLGAVSRHGPFTVNDLGIIQGWMTFDYVNKLFGLPSNYLKSNLNISDPHYPRLLIYRYAEKNKMGLQSFLNEVRNSIRSYLANK